VHSLSALPLLDSPCSLVPALGGESIVTTYDDDNDNKSEREEYNKVHGSGWVLSIKSILLSRCFEIAKLINLFCEQMRDGGDG